MKGRSGRAPTVSLQRRNAVERRQAVVREDQVQSTIFESADELGTGLHANDVAAKAVRLEKILHELRVGGVVLEQQNAQRRSGVIDHFFMLPGGGSLMSAQNTPSSFTALMNSWKSTGLTT